MKYFQNIITNAITGAILGSIFLLPYLGWLYSGHGIIMLDWTEKFLIVGVIWGVVCGIAIGFVPIMMKSNLQRRIIIGMIIGGLSGAFFFLIGEFAFVTEDNFSTILFKTLWGLGFGIIGGSISALTLSILYQWLKWIKIRDDFNDQNNQGIKRPFKEKVISSIIGLNTGFFIGNFLLVFVGQVLIAMYGAIYRNEILLVYLLPIILGIIAAIFSYIRPLKQQHLQKIMDGLRNGIVFALLSFLYFSILTSMILLLPFSKPEFMRYDSLSEFFLGIIGVFTFGFGFACGITGATLEEFLAVSKAKLKTTT